MRCSSCGSKNPKRARFCLECGVSFVSRCPKCGGDSPPHAKFCVECGSALPPAPANGASASALKPNVSQGEPSAAQLSREAQRGHVTVLLCDLVNLTGLDALGQEERREIIADYHRAATQAIERCGGHVTRNAGEGIMAYFGWPEPQENHAERAADAGLAILDAIEALNEGPSRSKLCARIGILSGTTLISGSNS